MTAGLAHRHLVPELLDALPADDPRARASRRDLAWINALMLQSRIMAYLLRRNVPAPPKRILEIGAGDGRFMAAVARRIGRDWQGVRVTLLDQTGLVTEDTARALAASGWRAEPVVADVFDWLDLADTSSFDIVCANLFLHHLTNDQLRLLFGRLESRAGVLVATEPRRNGLSVAGCHLLRLIGVNDVTRHDSLVSVRSGFSGQELTALWPTNSDARLSERAIGPFTHAFVARRNR